MFALIKYPTSLKMGHVRSQTKSLSQILEKSCVRSSGHIFRQTLMKLGQIVCLKKILDECENGSCRVHPQ